MTTTYYLVSGRDADIGIFPGATPEEAIEATRRDAGSAHLPPDAETTALELCREYAEARLFFDWPPKRNAGNVAAGLVRMTSTLEIDGAYVEIVTEGADFTDHSDIVDQYWVTAVEAYHLARVAARALGVTIDLGDDHYDDTCEGITAMTSAVLDKLEPYAYVALS